MWGILLYCCKYFILALLVAPRHRQDIKNYFSSFNPCRHAVNNIVTVVGENKVHGYIPLKENSNSTCTSLYLK
jgi:hypothetical protein